MKKEQSGVVIMAYCCSNRCAGNQAIIEKPTIDIGAIWCPDCGYAIFWKRSDAKSLIDHREKKAE